MSWLLIVTSLPARNATARMRAWRALKASGAAVLRDGAYLLPASETAIATLARVEQDVQESGGTAYVLEVQGDPGYDFAALFDRTADYQNLAGELADCEARFAQTPAAELVRQVRRHRTSFDALVAIDFFPGEAQRQVAIIVERLETRLAGLGSPHEPTGTPGTVPRRQVSQFNGRLWATRKRLWVDRVASAWLIRRFIDPQARFLWLDTPADCPPDALGFDFDDATFTHVQTPTGLLVTFETLLAGFGLTHDRALQRLAQIVHCLDVGGLPAPEAAGFERLLKGIRARSADDDALLNDAARVLDDLYLAFQEEASTT